GVGSAGNLLWSTVVDGAQIGDAGTFITPAVASPKPASFVTARSTFVDPNLIRANNSLAYYTPDFNGFKASLMYSFGAQNTYSLKNTGDMTSVSLNYAKGPLTVAYANQASKGGNTDQTDNQKFTTDFLAASYNFGVAKAALGYRTEKLAVNAATGKTKAMIYSVLAPFGAVTLKASYITKRSALTTDSYAKAGSQFAVGAVYDMSKRTALYVTYSRLKNESNFANSVGSAAASAGGVSSKGFDIGARHTF
ncbi:MAG: porin, partial [Polynucleobacter sp.]|nr:porin [Polynucleobacter sp.]